MHLFSLAFCVIRHPFDTFRALQASRDRFSWLPSLLLLVLLLAVRLCYLFFLHFPMAGTAPEDVNITMEILTFCIPLGTWAISIFAMTSILDGQTKFSEAVTATMYCMVPYILLALPLMGVSHLVSINDSAIFDIFLTAIEIWVVFLFLVSVKTMNEYSLKKTLLVVVLALLFMALICAVGLLMFSLASQLYQFVVGIVKEARFVIFGT